MLSAIEVKSSSPWVAIVSLVGEHDLGDYTTIKVALANAALRADNVIVDLGDCAFIDSTLLGTVISAGHMVAVEGGRVVVVLPTQGPVLHLAANLRLDKMISTFDTLDAAIASLDPPRLRARASTDSPADRSSGRSSTWLSHGHRPRQGRRRLREMTGWKRTHCTNGHLCTPQNTIVDSHGKRTCRACRRVRPA